MSAKILTRKKTQAVVVSCMDFRWQDLIQRALRESFGIKDPDYISLAGGAFHAASSEETHGQQLLKEDVGLAVEDHGARRIVLLNHEHCGKYAKAGYRFGSRDEELDFHSEELKRAGMWARRCFPSADVLLGIATVEGENVRIIPVDDY